jgi:hypothetical protein
MESFMKVADSIKEAMEKKGFGNLKDAAQVLGISTELLRVIVNKGHIPKDKTLAAIAGKLGLDKSVLILSAHQEKVPADVKGFFLSPSHAKFRRGKRKCPLSEEQINYLEKIISSEEILMLRKIRQVSGEAQTQIDAYTKFMYASKRSR